MIVDDNIKQGKYIVACAGAINPSTGIYETSNLLPYMTDMDYRNYPEDLGTLMPCSGEIQEHCK